MRDLTCKMLLIVAGVALFIQFCAVISLQAPAAYIFGGAAILFAALALVVRFAE